MKNFIFALLLLPYTLLSQVGIGTTDPKETLHINGTLRIQAIETTASEKIIGLDTNGTVAEVKVGDNLLLEEGTLHSTGSSKYFVRTIPIVTLASGHQFHNLELDLGGLNKDIVVFRLSGATNSFEVTGIKGGTDGKHILLMNVSTKNFKVTNESTGSIAANRISTLGTVFEQTSGEGIVELVYDGVFGRWIIINFRN